MEHPRLPPVPPPSSSNISDDLPKEVTEVTRAIIDRDFAKVKESFFSYLDRMDKHNLYLFKTALGEAIGYKMDDIVNYLLSGGVPLLKMHCYRATEVKSSAIYQSFLQNGWDINAPLDTYETPALGFIIDDRNLTEWFLDHGANPNAGCYFDYTPLSTAVKIAPMNTILLLFNRGGDIKKGQLLHHAVERGSDDVVDVLDLLLQKGAQLDARKYENHLPSWNMRFFMGLGTPLHGATRVGNLRVVKYLLDKGADPAIKDSKDKVALNYALEKGFGEIGELLRSYEKKESQL